MNILILQGSPRAKGNTAWMAEEYKKAALPTTWSMGDSPMLNGP